MTDLLDRPSTNHTTPDERGGRLGRALKRMSSSEDPGLRPLAVGAALAALVTTLSSLLLCMAVAVVGWFLADAGAHGQTTDALRVGADAWLVGHGAGITIAGVPLHVVPLTLTALFATIGWRTARWGAVGSAPPEDDRAVLLAVTVYAGIYLVVTVITCILAGTESATPGLGRAIVGALVLAVLAGGGGIASATGHLGAWTEQVPGWIRSMAYGAVATLLMLLAASAALVAVRVVMGINQASTVLSGLHLQTGDYVMYAAATVLVAPNAVLLGSAYLLGPGFAVGTGTVVSPSLVSLGPLPAFPLLSGLPDSGPTPHWTIGFMAIPVIVGILGAVMAQRAYGVTSYDSAALRGFGSGLGAALVTTVLIALAGGALGTGRLADIGAPLDAVLVAAVSAMSVGGLVAGVITAFFQRRRAARAVADAG